MHKLVSRFIVLPVAAGALFLFPSLVLAHGTTGTIQLQNGRYSPDTATIYQDEKLIFQNVTSQKRWPELTLDSGSKGASSSQESYSSTKPLEPGESWLFRFNYSGTWHYRDKINTNIKGNITVITGSGYSHVDPPTPESQSWWDQITSFFGSIFLKITSAFHK